MSFNPFLEKVLSLYFYIVDFLLWYWRAPITLSCFHERPPNQLLNRKWFDSNWIKEKDNPFKIWHEFIQEALYLDHLALPIRPTPQVTFTQQCYKPIWKSIKRSIGQSSSHFQDHLQSILIDPLAKLTTTTSATSRPSASSRLCAISSSNTSEIVLIDGVDSIMFWLWKTWWNTFASMQYQRISFSFLTKHHAKTPCQNIMPKHHAKTSCQT